MADNKPKEESKGVFTALAVLATIVVGIASHIQLLAAILIALIIMCLLFSYISLEALKRCKEVADVNPGAHGQIRMGQATVTFIAANAVVYIALIFALVRLAIN